MEADFETSYYERMDENARLSLRAIRDYIDILEKMKREIVLEATRLSNEETIKHIGPSAEVALTGIDHAINYLAVSRTRIQETDLVQTTRFRARLKRD